MRIAMFCLILSLQICSPIDIQSCSFYENNICFLMFMLCVFFSLGYGLTGIVTVIINMEIINLNFIQKGLLTSGITVDLGYNTLRTLIYSGPTKTVKDYMYFNLMLFYICLSYDAVYNNILFLFCQCQYQKDF